MKKKKIYIALLFFITSIFCCCILYLNKKKSKLKKKITLHATKCFSCEHELPPPMQYQSQKTKCFSCEKDMIHRNQSPSLGQPVKCFDCL